MSQLQYKMKTKIGPLYLIASKEALNGVYYNQQPGRLIKDSDLLKPEARVLKATVKQLDEYFTGQRKRFDLVFELAGTDFQREVWRELFKIPFGKTVSYKDIAGRIKNPKAVRAVGSANGKNPVCIIIPCHRVIAADGSIGGYAGGLSVKRKLLALENIEIRR